MTVEWVNRFTRQCGLWDLLKDDGAFALLNVGSWVGGRWIICQLGFQNSINFKSLNFIIDSYSYKFWELYILRASKSLSHKSSKFKPIPLELSPRSIIANYTPPTLNLHDYSKKEFPKGLIIPFTSHHHQARNNDLFKPSAIKQLITAPAIAWNFKNDARQRSSIRAQLRGPKQPITRYHRTIRNFFGIQIKPRRNFLIISVALSAADSFPQPADSFDVAAIVAGQPSNPDYHVETLPH